MPPRRCRRCPRIVPACMPPSTCCSENLPKPCYAPPPTCYCQEECCSTKSCCYSESCVEVKEKDSDEGCPASCRRKSKEKELSDTASTNTIGTQTDDESSNPTSASCQSCCEKGTLTNGVSAVTSPSRPLTSTVEIGNVPECCLPTPQESVNRRVSFSKPCCGSATTAPPKAERVSHITNLPSPKLTSSDCCIKGTEPTGQKSEARVSKAKSKELSTVGLHEPAAMKSASLVVPSERKLSNVEGSKVFHSAVDLEKKDMASPSTCGTQNFMPGSERPRSQSVDEAGMRKAKMCPGMKTNTMSGGKSDACPCTYPPAFKQFSCTGNISGNCNCAND